jgi:hypothetical protein
MTLAATLALVIPSWAAYLALRRRWSSSGEPMGSPLAAALAPGLAAGVSSCVYFLLLLQWDNRTAVSVDAVFWLAVTSWLVSDAVRKQVRHQGMTANADAERRTPAASRSGRLVVATTTLGFLAMAALAVSSIWARWAASPHGTWDAIGIWNLRARAIARGAPDWAAIVSPALDWSHPDYPLLLPVTIARLWAYAGSESTAIPAVVATLFVAATAATVVISVSRLRGWVAGLLAGTALLAARTYVAQSSCLCADVPLGFFALAAVSCAALALRQSDAALLVLAGGAAALAAWTKNEGLVLLALLGLFVAAVTRSPRALARVTLGAAVPMVAIAIFKVTLAPSSYLLDQGADALASKLGDQSRWMLVAGRFGDLLPAWGEVPGGAFAGLGLAVALTLQPDWAAARRALFALLVAAGMLAAYGVVYVITPADMRWQIATSFDRLVTQLWPAVVWAGFQLTGNGRPAFDNERTG